MNLADVYECAPLHPEVWAWLRERSFRVVEVKLPEGTGAGDVLFARAA